MKFSIGRLAPAAALVALTQAAPAFSLVQPSPGEPGARASATPGPAQIRLAHQTAAGTGVRYHSSCLSGQYGNPSARKSGYHLHGGGAAKYGVACSPYLKAPQPQTLSPGSLTNPQLKKQ